MFIYYIFSAIIKALIGGIILAFTVIKLNPFSDFWYAVIFFNIGLFFILWSLFFLFLLLISKIFFGDWEESRNYKISFLFGLYGVLNVVLMFFGRWNKLVGISLILLFIFVGYFLIGDNFRNSGKVK